MRVVYLLSGPGKNTGFTSEIKNGNSVIKELLSYIDVLIDGRFIESLKDPKLMYRGHQIKE